MTANLSSPADAKPQLSTLRRFFGYFAPYRHEIPVALLMVLIGATSQAIGPLLIGWSIDNLILQGNLPGLLRMLAILASIYVVGFGAIRAQIRRMGGIVQRLLGQIRQDIFDKVQSLPVSFF